MNISNVVSLRGNIQSILQECNSMYVGWKYAHERIQKITNCNKKTAAIIHQITWECPASLWKRSERQFEAIPTDNRMLERASKRDESSGFCSVEQEQNKYIAGYAKNRFHCNTRHKFQFLLYSIMDFIGNYPRLIYCF